VSYEAAVDSQLEFSFWTGSLNLLNENDFILIIKVHGGRKLPWNVSKEGARKFAAS
jgi:hypothetical protein